MLSDKNQVTKNVSGCRLQAGIIYGSNPRTATNWCHQPTGPTGLGLYLNNGPWGVCNAKRSAFKCHTWLG